MFAEASLAGLTDCRMRLVGLLHHGAHETGEFGQRPFEERLAKLHIAQEPIDRVSEPPVGCGGEQTVRLRRKMPGRRYRQIFLGREVMEECALGHAGALADVIHRGCRVTPGANDIHGRAQESGFRTGLSFAGWHAIDHTNRSVWRQDRRGARSMPSGARRNGLTQADRCAENCGTTLFPWSVAGVCCGS